MPKEKRSRREARRLSLDVAESVAAPPATTGNVHVVDESGDCIPSFKLIQDAVDAAQDGDTILVKEGNYWPFTVDAKGVVVVAELGAHVEVRAGFVGSPESAQPPITVSNLDAGQIVVLRGLVVFSKVSSEPALCANDCDGFLWFEDSNFKAREPGMVVHQAPSAPGVKLRNVSRAVFTRCRLVGRDGSLSQGLHAEPSAGLHATNDGTTPSQILLFGCGRIWGGLGNIDAPSEGKGAAGAIWEPGHADDFLYAAGSAFAGGNGVGNGDGGAGFVCSGTKPALALDCTFSGGESEPAGNPGLPVDPPTCVDTPSGSYRHLKSLAPVRKGETGEVTYVGVPTDLGGPTGDLVLLFFAGEPNMTLVEPTVSNPSVPLVGAYSGQLGVTDPEEGEIVWNYIVSIADPSKKAVVIFLQPSAVDIATLAQPSPDVVWGTPTVVVHLASDVCP